ncbi:PD-(D/E)XK motif protein [candidate division KSB1 bacterium]|nr:PD-(D/E)XK motif protein [candidate division KSB1 bacterium]
MDYRNLSIKSWQQLDLSGSVASGYQSVFLSLSDHQPSKLHIFRDESKIYHFAIEEPEVTIDDISDPGINGLQITVNQYRMKEEGVNTFIDIQCHLEGYLEEFTQVVKEIARKILHDEYPPVEAISEVIRKWRMFWATESKKLLTEDQQIGLICELLVLSKLCDIDLIRALDSWVGPLGEIHDFVFKDYSFEIKGTRRSDRVHRINGIEQLNHLPDKNLVLISFRVAAVDTAHSINLQSMIEEFSDDVLINKPELHIRFTELIKKAGYSPLFAEEYLKFNIEIIDAFAFDVDGAFPRLIPAMFKESLSPRITSLIYDISLSGMEGEDFNNIDWARYLL